VQRVSGQVSAERWEAMTSIFADAVELPPDERSAFVAGAAAATPTSCGKSCRS